MSVMNTTETEERESLNPGGGSILVTRAVAGASSLAFLVATGWYGLAVQGVTVPSEPTFLSSQTIGQRLATHFRWLADTLAQERLYTSIAIAAFVFLAWTALQVSGRTGRDVYGALAGGLVAAGSALWIVGNVIQLGGHYAAVMMATHGNPLETVASIDFAIDTVDDAFELAATATLGVGMLLFGVAAAGMKKRAWRLLSLVVGVALLATTYSYAIENGDLTNLMLLVCGLTLLPAWVFWSGTLVER